MSLSREEVLELQVEELEIQTELESRRLDRLAGIVPEGITRALFPHELAARTNFAALEGDLEASAAAIESRLVLDRGAFLRLLGDDLAGQESPEALVDRIVAVDGPAGVLDVKGAKALVKDAVAYYRGILEAEALAQATRVRQEAAAQGVAVPSSALKLDPETRSAIDRQALRLAQGPLVDLVRALRERAFLEAAR